MVRFNGSSPPAIGGDALIGHPHAGRQLARLPEHVDRDAAAWVPIAADPQPAWRQELHQSFADRDRAVLVKGAVVAKAGEVELERLRFDEPAAWDVVDHDDGEIRLTGDRTKRGEL